MGHSVSVSRDPIMLARENRHGVNHVVYSSGGSQLACSDVRMNVWVTQAGEEVFRRNFESSSDKLRPTERVRGLAFSPDERVLYVAAGDRIRAFELATGEEIWRYMPPRAWGFLIASPISLAVRQDGLIAAAFDNGTIGLWSQAGERKALWHDNDAPRMCTFVRDGQMLVGSDSFSLCGWDVETQKKAFRWTHSRRIFGMAADPSRSLIALRSLHEVTIVSLENGETVGTVNAGPGLPILAFHPTHRRLVLGALDAVEVVDYSGMPVARLETGDVNVISLAISPDGVEIAVGCSDDQVRRFVI